MRREGAALQGIRTLIWRDGLPSENGVYLVEFADDDHVVTPYRVPGQEGVDTWGDPRGSGWCALGSSGPPIRAWARIPVAGGSFDR